ncbi:MAG: glycosyltransferase family 2 protein [Candidatus Falkowbacteria bacterium]|nr:glycosyltransferase family 2 protein [Candidatus Falkowbacteria bacterium]
MNFSFIIINYRSLDFTRSCLNSLFEFLPTDKSWEIILIDNNSADGSAAKLSAEFKNRLTFIQNASNRGFATANNQGAKIAQGRYLFFLNSDTEIKTNILPPLLSLFAAQTSVGIIAPLVLAPNLKWQFGACGRRQTLSSLLFQTTKINWHEAGLADYWTTDWVSGAALIIRHDLFNKIGAWDENFFLYLEDTDLCFRIKKANYKVAICPTVSLIHYGGQSPATSNERRRHYYLSQSYFFRKHYGRARASLMALIRWPYKTLILLKK